MFDSFPHGGHAVVFGASGGIGGALREMLEKSGRFAAVSGLSRSDCDITREDDVRAAAAKLAAMAEPLRLVVVATGLLHTGEVQPEKSLRHLDPAFMAANFAVNTIGPALLMKHLLPLMAREGRAVFAVLSAKVASLGDNALGGWHSYRASKVALNMFVKNAAIEMARTRPGLAIAALHPGTVETQLSAPFAKSGLDVRPPAVAASDLAAVIDTLAPERSGGFFNHRGEALPW